MKIKLILSYDGTDYKGFQFQPNVKTVQGTLENAVSKLINDKIKVTGCSRTDSGVHANFQVATFVTCSRIPPDKYSLALKPYLPNDINVLSSNIVQDNFHPSRDAIAKMYTYQISMEDVLDIRDQRYFYHIKENFDFERIQEACKLLEGKKDFKSFCAAGSQVKTTIRTIFKIYLEEIKMNKYRFTIVGDGFLYKMVRIIVATLMQIGLGKLELNQLQRIIEIKDRTYAPYTAPAHGLCLEKIWYNKDIFRKQLDEIGSLAYNI